LAVTRRLAAEAADNNLVDPHLAAGIGRVKGRPKRGARIGNWQSGDLSERPIQAPPPATLTGERDRAMLRLLIGRGLRRGEAAALRWDTSSRRI